MIPPSFLPMVNHLWQSTLFGAAVLLLALALRKNRAQTRYWLWFTASAKFVLPFSLLVSAGNLWQWRGPSTVAPPVFAAAEQISQPFVLAAEISFPRPTPVQQRVPEVLIVIWACGGLVIGGVYKR
jgi:hypothetical protein